MIDETGTSESGNNERIGFCQDCGRSLTRESVSRVGSAVFCGPCLKARNAATAAGAPPPPPPYGAGAYGAVPPAGAGPVYTEPFPPVGGSSPSPVLAGFLGLIPGVGAMYNGQFAKGIAHIVIYAVLQSIANHNGVLGIVVAGWVFYQVFEAYHTAKARRDGLPLPDPLGLNHIGEYVGVHVRNASSGVPRNPGQPTSAPGWTGYVPPSQPIVTPPPATETPIVDQWGSVPAPTAPPSPYAQTASAWTNPAYVAPAPVVPPFEQAWASHYPAPPPARVNRFPAAALWLIGFGVLFCILNFVPDLRFSVHKIFPFLLIGLAVGIFVRRMTATGGLSPYDGENEGYTPRLVCSLRAPVVLFTVGVLWAMAEFGSLYFHQTWPVIVIVLGLMMLLERSVGPAPVVVPGVPVAPASDASAANGDGKGN